MHNVQRIRGSTTNLYIVEIHFLFVYFPSRQINVSFSSNTQTTLLCFLSVHHLMQLIAETSPFHTNKTLIRR